MKLGTYKDGSRDGQLVVVSRDLKTAHYASGIAGRLQQVLDDWNFVSPQLEDLSAALHAGKARHPFAFDPARCMAPLPRAYQRASVARPAGGEPVVLRTSSHDLLGPRDQIALADAGSAHGFEVELAVVTGDVAAGVSASGALDAVRLLMLGNDVALGPNGGDVADDDPAGVAGRPATAFAPIALTPDELGSAWRDGRLAVEVEVAVNGRRIGRVDAAAATALPFGELIARVCRARGCGAGGIVGSGPLDVARAATLAIGDVVRVDAKDAAGASPFGAIEQTVVRRSVR